MIFNEVLIAGLIRKEFMQLFSTKALSAWPYHFFCDHLGVQDCRRFNLSIRAPQSLLLAFCESFQMKKSTMMNSAGILQNLFRLGPVQERLDWLPDGQEGEAICLNSVHLRLLSNVTRDYSKLHKSFKLRILKNRGIRRLTGCRSLTVICFDTLMECRVKPNGTHSTLQKNRAYFAKLNALIRALLRMRLWVMAPDMTKPTLFDFLIKFLHYRVFQSLPEPIAKQTLRLPCRRR